MNHAIFFRILQKHCPDAVPEHRFHPTRKWRFDFASPAKMLAVEIDGGIWTRGRHARPAGILADFEKVNAAQILGWRALRYSPDQTGEFARDLDVIFAVKS